MHGGCNESPPTQESNGFWREGVHPYIFGFAVPKGNIESHNIESYTRRSRSSTFNVKLMAYWCSNYYPRSRVRNFYVKIGKRLKSSKWLEEVASTCNLFNHVSSWKKNLMFLCGSNHNEQKLGLRLKSFMWKKKR